jgi:protein SCO1/2
MKYLPKILAGLAIVVVIGAVSLLRVGQPAKLDVGGPFQLTEADGKTVSDKDFRGKYTLVYFGYTSCPDVCPMTMADVGKALKDLGPKASEVQPLFITVDPKRDTPAVLKSYLAAFSPRLIGLTGQPQQIASVEKEFHVYASVRKYGSGPDDYAVDHSSTFYLMGPDGHFITVLDASQDGDKLASTLSHYIG